MPQTTWNASITLGEPIEADGLRLVQGVAEKGPWADATVIPAEVGGSRCHRTAPTGKPRRHMGYWRNTHEETEGTTDALCLAVEKPRTGLPEVWLTVEFFETELGWIGAHYHSAGEEGFVHHVCPPEKRGKWDPTWINTADTNTWQRATIRLVGPVFNGKGPLGADLRFVSSGPLSIRKVTLASERPADFAETDQMAHAQRLETLLRPKYPKAAVPVSVGNIAGIMEGSHDGRDIEDMPPWLPVYKAMGFTALQSYVRWSTIEKVEGVWDWHLYDWVVDEAKRFGLKWIAFIMIGPWYAMPKWWLDSANTMRNKCLEHDTESWVQSIWNPVLLGYVERFMMKFAEHYPEPLIESIMVGIAGDFGESTTNGVFIEGIYHTHVGYWCGEDAAVADLRRAMRAKYGDVAKLNAAWGTALASFDDVRPVVRDQAPSDRAWLDQTGWYVDRMTWWMQRWGEICRKALPHTLMFNAAGGAGDPPRGAHWTDQTKALALTSKMGQRVTNEGADYAFNFAYTAWPGICCRFYDVPFGNEPWGGDMCGTGDLGRMYNAITQGATNFWFYSSHIRPPAGRLALHRALPFMNRTYRRSNRVAVYYPWTHFVLIDEHGFSEKGLRDRFWPQVEELRDVIDYDFVDDHLMRDGVMKDFDFLILLQGTTYEREELERIVAWVQAGGVLITHNHGVPATVEGDMSLGQRLMAFDDDPTALETRLGARIATVGRGRVVMFPRSADLKGWHGDDRWDKDHKDHPATHPGFWRMITATLANASALGTGLADYPVIDGEKDEVYGALMEHEGRPGILYFSQIERDVEVRPLIPGKQAAKVVVPAGQLKWVYLDELA